MAEFGEQAVNPVATRPGFVDKVQSGAREFGLPLPGKLGDGLFGGFNTPVVDGDLFARIVAVSGLRKFFMGI